MTDEQILAALEGEMRRTTPGFKRVQSSKSVLMRTLSLVVHIFNPRWLSSFSVSLPPYVYMPDWAFVPGNERRVWKILAHEFVHQVSQKEKGSFSMWLSYFFPQNLALLSVLSLLAIFSSSVWLWFLLFLLFLAPLPAPLRSDEEHTAYAMSMAVNYWRYGTITDYQVSWVANQFTSSSYYFMWPFRKWVVERVEAEALKVVNGQYDRVYPFSFVKSLVESNSTQLKP